MKQKTWDDCVQALRDERARLEAAPEWIDRVERANAFARVLSWLEARARLGVGAGRPRPVLGELSAEAKAARAPLRPEELVEAQHDRVHRDPGRTRAARTVRRPA